MLKWLQLPHACVHLNMLAWLLWVVKSHNALVTTRTIRNALRHLLMSQGASRVIGRPAEGLPPRFPGGDARTRTEDPAITSRWLYSTSS